MILVLNFDKNPLYRSCDGVVNCEFDLYQEIIYEVGYNLSDLSDENIEDKSQLILGLLGKENDVFEAINSQISQIINTLVSDNPTGTHEIVFSPRYIDWLRYNVNPAYHSIAEGLEKSNGKLDMSIDELYDQTISDNVVRKAKDTINQHPDIDCIVVSGVKVDDNSLFIKSITDSNSSVKVVDDNYEPLLQSLVLKYANQRDYETVISLLKKIDTFDSWLKALAHKIHEEADDINDYIQKTELKATSSREKDIISEIAKAWKLKNDNNLSSFDIALIQWIQYISDENNPINLSYYIAESRLDNTEEGIIWYKNSGDEGIIKAAYIHIGNVENMIEQLKLEYSDNLYMDICRICCTVTDMMCDFVHNSANHSVNPTDVCLIISQKILGGVQSDIMAVKYKGIDEFINYLSEIYNEVNDWLNKTDKSISGAKAWIENLLYFGGEKDVVERLEQRIAEAKIEFDRISDDYKAKIEEEKAEADAKRELIKRKLEGKFEWVTIMGGEFIMGDRSYDELAHEHSVTVSPFKVLTSNLSKIISVVTQNPQSEYQHRFTWDEYNDVINELNEIYGEHYSIISEAQYEYFVKYAKNIDKQNNKSGFYLHEIFSGISETKLYPGSESFCLDDYAEYPYSHQIDPVILLNNGTSQKVVRTDETSRKGVDRSDTYPCIMVAPLSEEEICIEKKRVEEEKRQQEEKLRQQEEKRQQEKRMLEQRQKELSEHKKTVLSHFDDLIQNRDETIGIAEEFAMAEQLKTHWKAVGQKDWSDEEKKKVDSIIGYYGLRGIVFNRNFSQGIGTDNWLRRENAKLTGYCCVFGIGRKVSYKAALDVIKQGKKARLIESQSERKKIEELCNLRTPMSKDAEKTVQRKRFAYMLETSDKFMNGDKESDIYQDTRFAFLILEKASDEGCEEATKRLSKCYREGIGTIKDEAKAKALYQTIAPNPSNTDDVDSDKVKSANLVLKDRKGVRKKSPIVEKPKKSGLHIVKTGCLIILAIFGLLFLLLILMIIF